MLALKFEFYLYGVELEIAWCLRFIMGAGKSGPFHVHLVFIFKMKPFFWVVW